VGDGWHDQTLFYRVIQPGKNRWNAAFWCGSPSVLRRAALESIGGVATGTVTEDLHTSIRLHARGWKTVFHDEPLAYGIAPQTLHAFTVQRLRWAQGAMQLLRSRDNPLFVPGLTLAQRLNYLASVLTYFDAYQKLIYLLTPSLILVTGLLPMGVPDRDFVLHWVPYFVLGVLANVALGRGEFRYLAVERFNLLKVFTFILAARIVVWPRPLRFQVTPKQESDGARTYEWRRLRLHLVLFGLIGASAVLGLLNSIWGLTATFTSRNIALMTFFWALANAGLLAWSVLAVTRRLPRLKRRHYRFPARLRAVITSDDGISALAVAENLATEGVGLRTSAQVPPGAMIHLQLFLEDGPVSVESKVRHAQALPGGGHWLGVQFAQMTLAERQRLVTFLFVTLPRREWEAAAQSARQVDRGRVAA
jgi:cellulose synthase (UDP-forming)